MKRYALVSDGMGMCNPQERHDGPLVLRADHETELARVREDRDDLANRLERVLNERDVLRDVLLSKHGGEPIALLGELDALRERVKVLEDGLRFHGGELARALLAKAEDE